MSGSQQLRVFRRAIRDGETLEVAAELAGFSRIEAQLTIRADEADPPGPDAYELIGGDKEMATAAKIIEDEPEADEATENPLVEMAAGTLRGDVRDSLLAWFKAQPKPWGMMVEQEQRDLADAADRFSRRLVREACRLIAAGERPCIVANLVEYKEKDGIEAKLKLPSKAEVVVALHEACGSEVLVVASGAKDFMGEGGPADIEPDQPIMDGIGGEYQDQ